jgi:hypothetical protein
MSTTERQPFYVNYIKQLQKILNEPPTIHQVMSPKSIAILKLLHPILKPVWDLRVSVQLPAFFPVHFKRLTIFHINLFITIGQYNKLF